MLLLMGTEQWIEGTCFCVCPAVEDLCAHAAADRKKWGAAWRTAMTKCGSAAFAKTSCEHTTHTHAAWAMPHRAALEYKQDRLREELHAGDKPRKSVTQVWKGEMFVWEELNDEFIKKTNRGGGGSVYGVPRVPSSVMTELQLHHDGAPVPMTTPGCQMEGSAGGGMWEKRWRKWWRSGTYEDLAVPFLCKGASDMAAAPVSLSPLSSFLLSPPVLVSPSVLSTSSPPPLLLPPCLRSLSSSPPAVPMCVCYARMC